MGAEFTVADDGAVDLANPGDFDRGSREEQLVGTQDVFHRNLRHARLDAQVGGDFQHRRPGDPHQDAGVLVVGDDRAILDDEEVLARAFRDQPLRIQKQRLVEPAALGVVDRPRGVDVLAAGLRPGGNRAVVELADGGHGDADAFIGVGQVLARRNGRDGDGDRTLLGPDAERGGVEEGHRPQIRGLQPVRSNDIQTRLGQGLDRVGICKS